MSSEMESVIQVRILDEADCVSFRSNKSEEGMNPSVLSPATSK